MARPLQKRYCPYRPYTVERHDWDDGSISYEIWDLRPASYRRLCAVYEGGVDDEDIEPTDRAQAKRDAELICNALNTLNETAASQNPRPAGDNWGTSTMDED